MGWLIIYVEGRYANTVLAQFIVVAISQSSHIARQSYEEKFNQTNRTPVGVQTLWARMIREADNFFRFSKWFLSNPFTKKLFYDFCTINDGAVLLSNLQCNAYIAAKFHTFRDSLYM